MPPKVASNRSSPAKEQKAPRLSGLEVGNMLNKELSPRKLSTETLSADEDSDNSYLRKVKSPVKAATSPIKATPEPVTISAKSWLVKVYTSNLNGKKMEGTDANVYVSLVGPKLNETGDSMLDKKKATSKNKDLFEEGQCDEFVITSPADIKSVKKVRIGHDNSGLGAGWHLNKVEVVDQQNGKQYVFNCNRWLAKNEDDGKIERVLVGMSSDSEESDNSLSESSSDTLRKSRIASPVSKEKRADEVPVKRMV